MGDSAEEKKIEATVSAEEVEQAKAEIAADVDGDDDVGSGADFEVTKEEMSVIRAELACEFPDDYTYLR